MYVARKRRIYDARSTLHKSSASSGGSSASSNGYYSRYRSGTGASRDYDYDSYYPSYTSAGHGSTAGGGSRRGNRYQAFTFRNLFEGTPFHKLFGKRKQKCFVFFFLFDFEVMPLFCCCFWLTFFFCYLN